MTFFIKLTLLCFAVILGFGGFFITQDYLKTIQTEEYKNSSLFGRFITRVIWGVVAVVILAFEIMIFVSVFSKITVG